MSLYPTLTAPQVDGLFELIDRTVLSSAAASISFTGISAAFRIFEIAVEIAKDASAGSVRVRLNGDSGANYDYQQVTGSDTSVAASRTTGASGFIVTGGGVAANDFAAINAIVAKPLAAQPAIGLFSVAETQGGIRIAETAGRWNNTAGLISEITLLATLGDFAAGTAFVLTGDQHA